MRSDRVAFREARLKSERLRIRIFLGIAIAAFLLRTFRAALLGGPENISSLLTVSELFAFFFLYEFLMLRAVNRATLNSEELASWVWPCDIVIETCLPALAVAFLSSESIDPRYRPLANPAGLTFFFFISLSTLRLNPALRRLSGLTAALSYLIAAGLSGLETHTECRRAPSVPPKSCVRRYAIAFILGGFVAGMVATEIRKQVEAAVREAETRREVERLEHELSVARSIQQSLLPSTLPSIEGFEIAGWNQPADQTGGDYYDWQVLPNGTVIAKLADVTGHGIGPALLAAVCRAYARANFGRGNRLLESMTRLNADIMGDIGEGRFVTFVAAVCTPRCSRVELLSAGHGPCSYMFRAKTGLKSSVHTGFPWGSHRHLSPTRQRYWS
jgi:Stage II sporulation protein E (SpoIIE)